MVASAAAFGTLTAVFANAGLGATVAGSETGDTANWREMIDVNIWGLCLTARHALPELRKTENGHLLMTGSRAGRNNISGSVYGATKWFVHGYGQNLAAETTRCLGLKLLCFWRFGVPNFAPSCGGSNESVGFAFATSMC